MFEGVRDYKKVWESLVYYNITVVYYSIIVVYCTLAVVCRNIIVVVSQHYRCVLQN